MFTELLVLMSGMGRKKKTLMNKTLKAAKATLHQRGKINLLIAVSSAITGRLIGIFLLQFM